MVEHKALVCLVNFLPIQPKLVYFGLCSISFNSISVESVRVFFFFCTQSEGRKLVYPKFPSFQRMMKPLKYCSKLINSPTILSYSPFCHSTRFLPLPCHFASTFRSVKRQSRENPNLVSSFREKPRIPPSVSCFASSSPMATPTQSTGSKPFSVLFVCLGNICRSPAAEGVFRDIVKKRGLDSKFNIDSAGTIDYHEVITILFRFLFLPFD